MAIHINDHDGFMYAEVGGQVVATARFSHDMAADGYGAWVVSYCTGRLFSRNEAITAMVLADRLACGRGDDDPFICAWRQELHL